MKLHGITYAILAVALVVTGQVLLKIGMLEAGPIYAERLRRPGRLLWEVLRHWQVCAGLSLYACAAGLWILSLSTIPLSVAYSFLGLSYVAVAQMSVRKLGERLTPAQWIGIVLVVTGVVTVALTL